MEATATTYVNGEQLSITDIPALQDNDTIESPPTPVLRSTSMPGMCKCITVKRRHTKYMHQLYAD